ncbi:MAG TPA: winged helix-turn-helix domain-containing protein [Chloroflexota bacterium]|nr:winged helix-turn-helix domain-containing protein [Chloroflexota bacterium]
MTVQEEQGVAFITLYARILNELAKNPRMAQEALARRLNVTMRTVQRHLTDLEGDGYIHVQRDRKPFTYEIAWERPLPHFQQLQVKTFRPDMVDAIAKMEGVADIVESVTG